MGAHTGAMALLLALSGPRQGLPPREDKEEARHVPRRPHQQQYQLHQAGHVRQRLNASSRNAVRAKLMFYPNLLCRNQAASATHAHTAGTPPFHRSLWRFWYHGAHLCMCPLAGRHGGSTCSCYACIREHTVAADRRVGTACRDQQELAAHGPQGFHRLGHASERRHRR